MPVRYRVLPYKQGSRSAKALSLELGGKVLRLQGSLFKPRQSDVLINWGNTTQNLEMPSLNPSTAILEVSNKLTFFNLMKESGNGEIIPPFYSESGSIPESAYPIVCRTVLAGHSGAGIVIAATPEDLVPAPLYVKYIKKQDEYRVHLGRNSDGTLVVIGVQRKARKLDVPSENVNWQVRNHQNGFVYVRQNVTPPESVLEVSKQAFTATSLDFGAVDVIWNANAERAYVLEINTAPGLEGETVKEYAEFFKERM